MSMKIPVLDLKPQIGSIQAEIMAAIQAVIESGQFINGPNVQSFEQEAASFLGMPHAVALNSGTDALVIALRALEIGPGDEVITTPFTFYATAEAISSVGATPVFVDIEPDSFNINPGLIEAAITPATRAIIPVHLFGGPADMGAIMPIAKQHGLRVIEDTAQAFGGEWNGQCLGAFGDFGCYSFFPTKNLNAFGDGGMLTAADDALAEKARMLRQHGAIRKYYNELIGYNSRLDEIQAAVLRVKLPRVAAWNQGRRRVALRYIERLAELEGITVPRAVPGHVFHQFTIRVHGGLRDQVQRRLAEAGIGTMIYYPVPVHKLPVYAMDQPFPHAELAALEVLSLPMYAELADETIDLIAAALKQALAAARQEA